jgi:hypothetical protein
VEDMNLLLLRGGKETGSNVEVAMKFLSLKPTEELYELNEINVT